MLVGCFRPAVSANLALAGMRFLGPTLSSTLTSTTPLFGVALGILCLGEVLTLPTAIGTIVIVLAVMILAKFGYDVTAVTGKKNNEEYLKSIGAKTIINKDDLDKDPRPLDKGLWDGVVDTVGGKILANALAQTRDNGIVAACGNAADIKLNTTVMPFIIRGVKLWGVNSVTASIKRREFVWNEVAKVINFELLKQSIKTIGLEELIGIYSKMLKGETSGRYIVDVNK